MQTDQSIYEVLIPLLNPNEPEALLAALHVQDGQQVSAGDLLCTLETTKSTAELLAEHDGFVAGLHARQGVTLRAGERLCYLAASPEWSPPVEELSTDGGAAAATPEGLRITQPALALAQSARLDLSRLPTGILVTEKVVYALIDETAHPLLEASISAFDASAILVYGGGGHGKALIDLIRTLHVYHVVAVIDDGIPVGEKILGIEVLGGAEMLANLYDQGVHLAVNAVGGIGNLPVRLKVFERLAEAAFVCPTLVHPSAVVEPSARLAAAVQVMPLAYVGSEAEVGYGAIVNTGAIVSHDCRVGNYANLSPGAILAGEVQIGSGALIGMGATVNLRAKVGSRARVGNGATVKSDVPDGGIVRAGSVWPE
jgi:sugar O-acyltransferase (sialic acid O-acetyltransferase NeuD family)